MNKDTGKGAFKEKESKSIKKQLLINNSVFLGIHVFLSIPYYFVSPGFLFLINLLSISFYLGSYIYLIKGRNSNIYYPYNVMVEILFHDIFCILVFGWKCEFQLWIIALITTFLKDYITLDKAEYIRKRYIRIVVGIGFFTYVSLYLITKYANLPFSIPLSEGLVTTFALLNFLITFSAITAFTTIYVKQMELKYTELNHLADYDQLTGLGNRYYMMELLAREERDSSLTSGYSLAMIDIDFFKKVNDTYGHNNGDIVLVEIAKILSNNLPEGLCVGRWGGEEFLMVANHKIAFTDFKELLENIRSQVADHIFELAEGQEIHCTISIGASQYQQGQNIKKVIKKSDDSLYKAKNKGRNLLVAC